MDCDKIKFLIKETKAGFVVFEYCYQGSQRVSEKELGMVHPRKEEALKLMDSLVSLTRLTCPHTLVESEG